MLLDLHSTSGGGPPFIVMGDTLQNRELAFALKRTIEERLASIEKMLEARLPPAPKPPASGFLAWMGAELPKLLAAIVVLVLGFALKDSVDLAIKQRQLDLSYTKEMQGLLQQLSGGGTEAQMQSAAVLLASYGEPALPGLMSTLRRPGLGTTAPVDALHSNC